MYVYDLYTVSRCLYLYKIDRLHDPGGGHEEGRVHGPAGGRDHLLQAEHI